jgi:hypothetical protein
MVAVGLAQNTSALLAPAHLLLFVLALAVYFLPTALAMYRDCTATVWIALIDVLLGWTVIGWFVALGWAAGGKTHQAPPAPAGPPNRLIPGHR